MASRAQHRRLLIRPPGRRTVTGAALYLLLNSCLSFCSRAGRQRVTNDGRRVEGPAVLFNPMATSLRPDRRPGNRAAFEAARQKILKTQTVCGICGKPVDFSFKYPHPLSPTVDHIIPVSKGGHPSDLANLQLAHRWCNRAKSNKLIDPVKADADDRLIPNDELEQHNDWKAYRAPGG